MTTYRIPETCHDIDLSQSAIEIVDETYDALRDEFSDDMDPDELAYMSEEVADALISGRHHVIRSIYKSYGIL